MAASSRPSFVDSHLRTLVVTAATLLLSIQVAATPFEETPLQDAMPDLAVTNVRMLAGPERQDGEPIQSSFAVYVTVLNRGGTAAAYSIEAFWQSADGAPSPLNGANATPVLEEPLAPEEGPRTTELGWTLQPEQDGAGKVIVHVAPITTNDLSDARPEDNERTMPVFVRSRHIQFEAVGLDMRVDAGTTGFLRFAIRNLGNSQETVILTVPGRPSDVRLTAFLESSLVRVPAGGVALATLYVNYAPNGNLAPFSVTYGVAANPGFGTLLLAQSKTLQNGSASPASGASFEAARAPGPLVRAAVGSEGRTTVTITNTGVVADNYTISSVNHPRWSAVVVPNRLALYPGESGSVEVRVRPGTTEASGNQTALQISARSGRSPAHAVEIPVIVAGAAPRLSLSFVGPSLYPGDIPKVEVEVTNIGTETESGGTVRFSAQGAGTSPLQRDLVYPSIQPGESFVSMVDLLPCKGGPISINGTLESDSGTVVGPILVGAMTHLPDLKLTPPLPLTGRPGSALNYTSGQAFVVKNSGNLPEVVTFFAKGVGVTLGTTSMFLQVNETKVVPLVQTLPRPSGNQTELPVTLTTSVPGFSQRWSATVTSRLIDAETPKAKLVSNPPAKVKVGETTQVVIEARDNDDVARVTATVVDPNGTKADLSFVRGKADLWHVNITFSKPGLHSVAAKAVDLRGNPSSVLQWNPIVVKGLPPQLRVIGVPPSGSVNQTDLLRIVLEDDFGVDNLTVSWEQDGKRGSQQLPTSDGVAFLDLTGLEPGKAKLVLKATNTRGENGTLALEVTVLKAAQIRPSDWASALPIPAANLLVVPLLGALILRRWSRSREDH